MITSRGNLRQTRLILIGAAVLLSLGMSIRQSFGLFLTPVTRDLALTAADLVVGTARHLRGSDVRRVKARIPEHPRGATRKLSNK
jgi:hypothetical protein